MIWAFCSTEADMAENSQRTPGIITAIEALKEIAETILNLFYVISIIEKKKSGVFGMDRLKMQERLRKFHAVQKMFNQDTQVLARSIDELAEWIGNNQSALETLLEMRDEIDLLISQAELPVVHAKEGDFLPVTDPQFESAATHGTIVGMPAADQAPAVPKAVKAFVAAPARTVLGMAPVQTVTDKNGKKMTLPVAQARLVEPEPEPEYEQDVYDPHSWEWLSSFDAREWIKPLTPRIQLALMMYYAGFEQAYALEQLIERVDKEPKPFEGIRPTRMLTVLMKEQKFMGVNVDQVLFMAAGESKGTKYTPHLLTEKGFEVCRDLIQKKVEEILGE